MPAPVETLPELTADAYEHLYDIVYLRTHRLLDALPNGEQSRKDRAWQLHNLLLEVVDELDPGPDAPAYSREWRRHRLMVLRYVDGLDPQATADRLAISRRTYYREHEVAIEAAARLLSERLITHPPQPRAGAEAPVTETGAASRLELLRQEAAHASDSLPESALDEVLLSVTQLVGEMARNKGVSIHLAPVEPAAQAAVDRGAMRQLLLGILGYLITRLERGEVRIAIEQERWQVTLLVRAYGESAQRGSAGGDADDAMRLAMLTELAEMQRCRLAPFSGPEGVEGFWLTMPVARGRQVLVVDDNEDVLWLLRRYLAAHGYQVVTASSGGEAVELAKTLQPFAITLDLMMPDLDGWDVLQTLNNHSATQHIPVVVCTVLSARELALSLGAAAFIEKPVSESALLAALQAIEER